MRPEPCRVARGFTLVEVLVALAIVALGLVATFGQMNQSATAASRLREKTLASWVAMNELTKLRLSGEFPGVGTRSDDIEMANQRWHYEIRISETEGDYLRRADVTVALADAPGRPLATAAGFVAESAANAPGPAGTGWPLITGAEPPPGAAPPPSPDAAPVPMPEEPPEPVTPPEEGVEPGGAER
jgi:general secretion pathway protein I